MIKNPNFLKTIFKFVLLPAICIMIVFGGLGGMKKMIDSKQPPAKNQKKEKGLFVETAPVIERDISLVITGYGQAYPVEKFNISPEVSGRIVWLTPLKEGEIIPKGERLMLIDDTDFKIARDQAEIQVRLKKNLIKQLTISFQEDKDRLSSLAQNTRLSHTNWNRLKTLYEKEGIGTLSIVESGEQSYLGLLASEKILQKTIELYPLMIQEAQSNLKNAISDLETARLNLERCVIKAPITGRIKEVAVEKGSYINTGIQALVLADDSVIEIQIALSDKDAFELLNIESVVKGSISNSQLNAKACRVETVTGNIKIEKAGFIHRIVCYDADTRTLTLAVRVQQNTLARKNSNLNLMDGMFCKVDFSGKTIEKALKISTSILNSDNTIYISRNNRLKTVPVVKIMENGNDIYVSGNFKTGDRIITTPLASPIENSLLNGVASQEYKSLKPVNLIRRAPQ